MPVDWYAGSTKGDVNAYLPLDVSVDADANPAAGRISATATASDAGTGAALNTATDSALYNVAEPVELTAEPVPDVSGPDGYAFSEQYTVTNTGTTTVHGVVLELRTGYSLTGTRHKNCRYGTDIPVAYCLLPNDLVPGQTYTMSVPQDLQIPEDHLAPFNDDASAVWRTLSDAALSPPQSTTVAGDGPPLSLVVESTGAPAPPLTGNWAPQTDRHYHNIAIGTVKVTGTKVADLAAVGAEADGVGVGQPTTLQLGVRDIGPASADASRSGTATADATVTIPAGTEATGVPIICAPIVDGQADWSQDGLPGFAAYECPIYGNIDLAETIALPFTVTPTVAQDTYSGSISISTDTNTANNTATIVLDK